ncbi:MAG TPA: hypothetical protein VH419_10860, partial [Nocardioidaceae bacterium]
TTPDHPTHLTSRRLGERMRIRKTISAALLAAVMLAGCSGTSGTWVPHADGPRGPEASDKDNPADRTKNITDVLTELRDVDPCALLDREVIKTLTKVSVGPHLPGRHLSECHVDTDIDEYTIGWSFGVDVGQLFHPAKQTQQEKINDEDYYTATDDTACSYTRLVSPAVGVTLTTIAPLSNDGDDPCDMAKAYLTKAGATFTDLPRRDQQLTKPQIPLAGHDPCETAPEVAKALHAETTSQPIRPYLCSIDPKPPAEDSPLAGQELTIAYEFKPDPRDDLPNPGASPLPDGANLGDMTPVTIAGHRGTQFDGTGDLGCGIDLVVNEKTVLKDDTITYVQVMSTLAKDCGISKRAAEAVMARLDRT